MEKKSCWFYGSGQEEKLQSSVVVRRRPSGEAVLLSEKLLESFVRSPVDYKELSRLTVSSCQWRLKFTSR